MKTLVAGMGTSGLAIAQFLRERRETFDTYDDRKEASELPISVDERTHFTGPHNIDLSVYGRLIVSPGLAADHPLLVRAASAGVPILSELELAFRHVSGTVIAVTGSNGKSTTASLTHHLLRENGLPSVLCGNIGIPFISRVSENRETVFVVEVSSFQLEHVSRFRPHLGMLLNISPDHLDRHGNLETYEAVKLRLFENQESDHLALVPPDYADRIPGRAAVTVVPGPNASLGADALIFDNSFSLDKEQVPLLGVHNHLNTLYACVAARHLGCDSSGIKNALSRFKGLPHRLERVGLLEGRLWINDSKATNTHAAQSAIAAMDRPYVLILGGCDKGERFSSLQFGDIPPKAIVAYGETAPLIREDLANMAPIHRNNFHDACLAAHEIASPGETVLLAPACASFDQFPNFEKRGETFKQYFQALSVKV